MTQSITTIQDLAHFMNQKFDNLTELVIKNQEITDEKFEGLTETIFKNFDRVENRLSKIEFNTSGTERRVDILEDKIRIISDRIGLHDTRDF